MAVSDTYVRARIDNATKERATAALGAMGLSISDAIRLLMLRIADERRLPFEVKVPNAATREAMAELAAGKGTKFASVEALMADLGTDQTIYCPAFPENGRSIFMGNLFVGRQPLAESPISSIKI